MNEPNCEHDKRPAWCLVCQDRKVARLEAQIDAARAALTSRGTDAERVSRAYRALGKRPETAREMLARKGVALPSEEQQRENLDANLDALAKGDGRG